MSYTLAINSSNVVGSNNNTFQYNFISGAFEAKDCEISVSSLTIPYSWFNITSIYNNKTISITFPYLATTTTLSITLPDGFYQISDINNYIQQLMIANGLYILTSAGLYTYFFQIYLNVNYYNIQVILSAVPTTLTGTYLGYTQPLTGYWSAVAGNGLPTVSSTPSFTLASTGSIASVIGFTTGTYASTSTSQSISGTLTPNGSTVNALLLRCNLIYNNIGTPTDILDLIPLNGVFGYNITYDPNFQKWLPIRDGRYSSATFTFSDQNLNTLYARDPNIALSLLVRKKRID